MARILAAFHLDSPDSLKRFLAAALTGICILAVNPLLARYGIAPVSDAALESVAGLVAAYLLQSGVKAGLATQAPAPAPTAAPVQP